MNITYVIQFPSPVRVPPSAKLRIEVRDTSLADAKSITLASAEIDADTISGLASVEGQIQTTDKIAPGKQTTIWAHLSMSGESKAEKGDFITTRYFPVRDNSRVNVVLQRIES